MDWGVVFEIYYYFFFCKIRELKVFLIIVVNGFVVGVGMSFVFLGDMIFVGKLFYFM